MEFPRVLFQLDSGSTFSYELGYEKVSDVDLVALVKATREALLSLETEIETRNITTENTKAIRSLRDNFKKIETRERLDDAGHRFTLNGIDAVKSPLSANPGTKRYQEFLSDIFRLKRRGLFLLCAATFSKERIRTMKRRERLNSLIYLKANKTTFDSTILDNLAVQYGVPNYDEHFPSEARDYQSNSTDAACQTSENSQAMFTADYSASESLHLDEAGARILLDETKKSRHALTITLPAPHAHPPFMIIPHEICADIMRLHTS